MALLTGIQIPNRARPVQGGTAVPFSLIFAGAGTVNVSRDFVLEQQQGVLEFAQSIWIDNSLNGAGLAIAFSGTLYTIQARANSQGIYPVIAATGGLSLTATTTAPITIPCILFNQELSYVTW
jgi:hypothetical protein